jgi:hypothetical protein
LKEEEETVEIEVDFMEEGVIEEVLRVDSKVEEVGIEVIEDL